MDKFIEEFYYGNLDPQARSTKENKVVQKQMEVLMLNEDFLTENLSGESKKKFLDFVNAWGVVNGESNLDSFIMGFRLGAQFTYDTFVNDEAPFKDLLRSANMKEKKYYIALDDFERRVVVNCMNEMRNKLIANGKYTDALDEVLLKVIHSNKRNLK